MSGLSPKLVIKVVCWDQIPNYLFGLCPGSSVEVEIVSQFEYHPDRESRSSLRFKPKLIEVMS